MAQPTMTKRAGIGKPVFQFEGLHVRPINQKFGTTYGIFKGKKQMDLSFPKVEDAKIECIKEAKNLKAIAAQVRARKDVRYKEHLTKEQEEIARIQAKVDHKNRVNQNTIKEKENLKKKLGQR